MSMETMRAGIKDARAASGRQLLGHSTSTSGRVGDAEARCVMILSADEVAQV